MIEVFSLGVAEGFLSYAAMIVLNPAISLPISSGVRWTPSLGQDRGNVKVGSRYPQWVWC
jgi:hypothetical protein